MIRTSILSMAFLVLMGTTATPAEEPKQAEDKEGFRVYTISRLSGIRQLQGVHASPKEAFQTATKFRGGSWNVEVTTGSEGKQVMAGRPVLYQVYRKTSEKSGWQHQGLFADEKKAEAVAKTLQTKGAQAEIVRDYAPKEVYHVYGKECRVPVGQKSRLLGTYVTLREAYDAAEDFRTNKRLRCEVTSGRRGQDLLDEAPTQYKVYVRDCTRSDWTLAKTTNDAKKAQEVVEARKQPNEGTEVVLHFGPAAK